MYIINTRIRKLIFYILYSVIDIYNDAIYFNEPPANSPRKYQLICSKTSIKDIPEILEKSGKSIIKLYTKKCGLNKNIEMP